MHWFGHYGEDPLQFLGSEMTLLDTGDYDGDGYSEFVFWVNGYNENGYRIVFGRLQETATFVWHYH